MPAARQRISGPTARVEPYSRPPDGYAANHTTPSNNQDKENQAPPTAGVATQKQIKKASPKSEEPDRSHLPEDYLDIELEEIKGEVPCYENASVIRRKLAELLETKSTIPNSTKKWNKTSLCSELHRLARKNHGVKVHNGLDDHGPSVPSLGRFLKKSGSMGGADTGSYYWGNMLLEKLRIWNGEKKTTAREKAEQEFPAGHVREDPNNMYFTCSADLPPPSYEEAANLRR